MLAGQCLARRIEDKATLIIEAAAWNADRNARNAKVNWRFSTADARIKLKRLYRHFEWLGRLADVDAGAGTIRILLF